VENAASAQAREQGLFKIIDVQIMLRPFLKGLPEMRIDMNTNLVKTSRINVAVEK
jgi:hypothetical protein